ncbi:SdpA family antimicrobial peptide system protein [Streptomyces sp. NPDC047829]|uniref:SdpA family antimicrobial peptide system protein n=1 Tax=Streptomyces sp. NPDC047829 TaxID=3154609 RepID=UPI00340AFDED
MALPIRPRGSRRRRRSATDPQYAPYRFQDGQWESASLTPHSRASNAFGFDRASRSQGIEIALLLHEEGIEWTKCDASAPLDECLGRAADRTISLTNSSPSPTLCGRAAVAEMHPVPWAWRHFSPDQHTPKRVAVWDVKCP